MLALLVVDAQNEFSAQGLRQTPGHAAALRRIRTWVQLARQYRSPIAWVQHHNLPHEQPGFAPNSWGAALSDGLGPQQGYGPEAHFTKTVFGAFAAEGLRDWLTMQRVSQLLITGFFAHMCVSTSAREALVGGFDVFLDPTATAAHALRHPILGEQSAEEVRRTAMLQLIDMGARLAGSTTFSTRAGTESGNALEAVNRRL